jgi:hypothetical protein
MTEEGWTSEGTAIPHHLRLLREALAEVDRLRAAMQALPSWTAEEWRAVAGVLRGGSLLETPGLLPRAERLARDADAMARALAHAEGPGRAEERGGPPPAS